MNQSGCCWTTLSMAVSTSASMTAFLRVQNVSGSPMPYLQAVAAGEAGVEGAVVGVGEGAAGVGDAPPTGAEGLDPPPHDNRVAASDASRPVRPLRKSIPSPPGRRPTPSQKAGGHDQTARLPRSWVTGKSPARAGRSPRRAF